MAQKGRGAVASDASWCTGPRTAAVRTLRWASGVGSALMADGLSRWPSTPRRPARLSEVEPRSLASVFESTGFGRTLTGPPAYSSTDRLEDLAWQWDAVQHPTALVAGPAPMTGRPPIILSSSGLIAGVMR
jgi:uncharacterized protein YbjT (DUF2867 family)